MIWTYILASILLMSSLVSLAALIYCLVELGKLSFDNKKKKEEKKKAEEEKELLELERRIQSYVEYKQRKIAEQNKPVLGYKEENKK